MRTMQVLILILQDSVVKLKEKCYPQTLLEECKDEIKYTKMEILIDDDLEKVHLASLIMNLIMIVMMRMN